MATLQGRRSECVAMDRLLDTVRGGRSAVLVVRGEAGIGKTALLQYLVERASEFVVNRATGVESEMELPFAGLHELCAPMLGRLGLLAEPQRQALSVALGLVSGESPDRFLVALAALGLVSEAAEQQPSLCVVDDAQWLDHASAQALGFVGRRLLAEPIALVFAARDPVPSRDELAGLPELRLRGLDDTAARAVLATVVSGPVDELVLARVVEETYGNPLALLEFGGALSGARVAGGFALLDAPQLPERIEEQYADRLAGLPHDAQRLVLLAAADPVGDAALLLRAARLLGLEVGAAQLAADAGLLQIAATVRFRHPLVRSAAYRRASIEDRRAAHGALAAATDAQADPDRRAWHLAHAARGPDEDVAAELITSAGRAHGRGGVAASAAFWARAVALTPDAERQATRAITAAEAKYAAGDFDAAQALLATADAGPLGELDQARVQRMKAQVAFALKRGSDAPPLLLSAARRLQPLDAELSRQTYLEALVAAIYAGRLAHGDDVIGVARAAMLAPFGPEPLPHPQLLLRGLSIRLTDGYLAAAPVLKEALRAYRASPQGLDWLCVAYNLVAMDLWDDEAWFELAGGQAQLARASGTLSWLPFVLNYLAECYIQAGELSQAAAVLTESERVDPGVRAETLPYVPLLIAAWRGDASSSAELRNAMLAGASSRGEGTALTYAEYAQAVLCNGLGDYWRAAEAARAASVVDELVISPWALYELVEGAARSGQREVARAAADRLSEVAVASGSNWAYGAAARSQALLSNRAAEDLFHEAIERLSGTRVAAHLARARLSYGEWLRRENRRMDARDQLRPAHEAFASMGASAFAERARRELQATGERARKRDESTRVKLTPQETEIAELARKRKTNAEIGAELFLSARTVEWHLRKVFTKLGISSRRELDDALDLRGGRTGSSRS